MDQGLNIAGFLLSCVLTSWPTTSERSFRTASPHPETLRSMPGELVSLRSPTSAREAHLAVNLRVEIAVVDDLRPHTAVSRRRKVDMRFIPYFI